MTVREAAFLDSVVTVGDMSEKPGVAMASLAAIAGLCNDANFENAATKMGEEKALRKVNGDATGALGLDLTVRRMRGRRAAQTLPCFASQTTRPLFSVLERLGEKSTDSLSTQRTNSRSSS